MSTEIKNPQAPELNANTQRGAEFEVVRELYSRFGTETCHFQRTRDGVPTLWVPRAKIQEILHFLKQLPKPFSMLYDLSAIDEQLRTEADQPTIGILLCKNKDRLVAEYALSDIQKPIGVSEYQLTQLLPENLQSKLPSIEDIENELGGER